MSEEKREEATPRQERRARERGRAWQSRDLSLGAVLVAAGLGLRLGAGALASSMRSLMTMPLDAVASGDALSPRAALEGALTIGADLALPLLAAIVIAGAATSALQVGPMLAPAAVTPDAARLDPTQRSAGAAKLGASLAMTLARLLLVLVVCVLTLREAMPGIATLSRQPIAACLAASIAVIAALLLRTGVALVSLGVLDAILERALYRASLRMSRREVLRERREAEGDAHVARERSRAREEISRHDAEHETRSATLVIADREELTVALAYDEEDLDAVPRVVAIGRGESAPSLVRVAMEHGVPRCEDGDLAGLLAIVPLGAAIPDSLYEPVARVMHSARAARS